MLLQINKINIIGFMDGVSFLLECISEFLIQNSFYSGDYCDVVNNLLAYSPDGKVFFCFELPGKLG